MPKSIRNPAIYGGSINWRKIATAPKDGQMILLYSPDGREPGIFVGVWVQFEGEDHGEWFDAWQDDGCKSLDDIEMTHWMPLPSTPEVEI